MVVAVVTVKRGRERERKEIESKIIIMRRLRWEREREIALARPMMRHDSVLQWGARGGLRVMRNVNACLGNQRRERESKLYVVNET